MSLKLVLNLVETTAMPLDLASLMRFESSQYSFTTRAVARRLRANFAAHPALEQYVESIIFDTLKIEQDGDEDEIGGSTISLNDGVSDQEIMVRFREDVDPMYNGGTVAKYAVLCHWKNGVLTSTFVTVTEEAKNED